MSLSAQHMHSVDEEAVEGRSGCFDVFRRPPSPVEGKRNTQINWRQSDSMHAEVMSPFRAPGRQTNSLLASVAMETPATAGPSCGRTGRLSVAPHREARAPVILCRKQRRSPCHAVAEMYKPPGAISHSNIRLAVKLPT